MLYFAYKRKNLRNERVYTVLANKIEKILPYRDKAYYIRINPKDILEYNDLDIELNAEYVDFGILAEEYKKFIIDVETEEDARLYFELMEE